MNKELLKKNYTFLEQLSKEFTYFESAEFLPNNCVEIISNSDNLRASATNRLKHLYSLQKEQNDIKFQRLTTFPQQFNLSIESYSPTYTYMAALQSHPGKYDDKKKKFLEIYNHDTLIDTLNLEDFHEEILKGGTFGKPFVWNKQENKIMYLAKLKEPKKQSFWENQLDEKQIEEAYNTPKYISDYGEQFENIYQIGLFIYDLQAKTLEQILLPDNIFPAYPQFFDHAGEQIILALTPNEENFKLGSYACSNRKCGVYLLEKNCLKETLFPSKKEEKDEKEKKEETIKPKLSDFKTISTDAIAIYPKVSPDLEKIAYFSSPPQKAHQFIMELKIYDKKTESTKTVIPIYQKIDEKLKFSGITCQQAKFIWFENSKHALLNSHIDNEYHFYLLDVTTNEIKLISPEIENNKTMNTIFTINKFSNDIIFKSSNFKNMIELNLITGLNLEENTLDECCKNMKLHPLQNSKSTSPFMSQLKTIMQTSKQTQLRLKNSQANGMLYSLTNYSTEYLNIFQEKAVDPQIISDENKPLIVIIHGGPHSTSGVFSLLRLIFLLKGYNVLVPSYTGTLGYGQEFNTELLGKISELEFNEIAELISQAVDLKLCHPEKIFSMGGSNGGYLTGLLAGKENPFNVKLRAGILLNPVLNLPYNAIASDIIDWVYAECFNKFFENYKFTPEDQAKMYEQSPMNYPSKIPLLLLLGKVDRRVPFHQGLAYTVQCQRNNQSIETFVYPKSNHALSDSLNTDYDVMLRCLNFIENQLEK